MSASGLAEALADRSFVLTVECPPPRGALGGHFTACAAALKDSVDAMSVPESQDGPALCSLAGCSLLASAGAEPVLNLVTRDLNRIALQAAILGACALGVRNVLCLSGRHQALTDSRAARGVFDIGPIQLLRVADAMRKEGRLANGEPIEAPLELVLGTDTNPFADPLELQVLTLEKAVAAGSDFIVTQPVFDLDRFSSWADQVCERGIHDRAHLIAGVMLMASARQAADLAEDRRRLHIPSHTVEQLAAAPDQRSAGIELAVTTVRRLREIEGIRGVHLSTGGDLELAGEVLRASDLWRN
jgi:methylenetetrahydrofolate reductase (NADPH)